MLKLRKCPKCKEEYLQAVTYERINYVACLGCGDKTSFYYSMLEAMEAWNRRVEKSLNEIK